MAASNNNPGFGWLLFSPSGRIGRQAYLMSFLLWAMLLGVALSLMFTFEYSSRAGLILSTLAMVIISAAAAVSMIMLSIKRLHDMGLPGLVVIVLFVPVATLIAFIVLLVWPSAPPNDFGQYPNRPK